MAILLRISCPLDLLGEGRVETCQLLIYVALFALFALSYPPGQDSFSFDSHEYRTNLEINIALCHRADGILTPICKSHYTAQVRVSLLI